jgi:hypothetical protein
MHLFCPLYVIFVSLVANLLPQFGEFFANLELAKLPLVGPISQDGLPVIVIGFKETQIFVNPSHSIGEGIMFALSIYS